MGLATLARKNRLFAWLGSRISNMVFLPFIALAEVQLSHRIRTGAFVDLAREDILAQAPHLLLDWCLGTIPVGVALGIVMGLLAYAFAKRRDARRARTAAATDPAPETNRDSEDGDAVAGATDAGPPASPKNELGAAGAAAASPTRPTPAELPPPSSGSPA